MLSEHPTYSEDEVELDERFVKVFHHPLQAECELHQLLDNEWINELMIEWLLE